MNAPAHEPHAPRISPPPRGSSASRISWRPVRACSTWRRAADAMHASSPRAASTSSPSIATPPRSRHSTAWRGRRHARGRPRRRSLAVGGRSASTRSSSSITCIARCFRSYSAASTADGVLLYETFAQGNGSSAVRRIRRSCCARTNCSTACASGSTVVAFEQGRVDTGRPAVVQRLAAVGRGARLAAAARSTARIERAAGRRRAALAA